MAVIKDVARQAGVSTGTVSKFINGAGNLKPATRTSVEQAIAALQYRPSSLARSMRTGRTDNLAVMVPDITNPFFAEVYQAIRRAARRRGLTSILYTTEDDLDAVREFFTDPAARQVDGVILCFFDETEAIQSQLLHIQEKMPLVRLSWDIHDKRGLSVAIDVLTGMQMGVRHLLDRGYRRLAYIGGPQYDPISREKYRGYRQTLEQAGLQPDPLLTAHGPYSLQAGFLAADRLAGLPEPPQAIVAENDLLAIGCIKALLRRGIRIPQQMAVIGFDDIPLAAMYEPSLSTITLPVAQIGEEAIRLFIGKKKHPAGRTRQIILQTKLTVRDTTGPAESSSDTVR